MKVGSEILMWVCIVTLSINSACQKQKNEERFKKIEQILEQESFKDMLKAWSFTEKKDSLIK